MPGTTRDLRRRHVRHATSTTTAPRTGRCSTCAARFAQAVNDRWSYKIGAGYLRCRCAGASDGPHPERRHDVVSELHERRHAAAALRRARGLRLCRSASASSDLPAATAGTDGMMHTGIGPFDIDSGAKMGYWRPTYTRKAMKLQAFMNMLDGDATNVVSVDPTGDADRPDVRTEDVRRRARRHAAAGHARTRSRTAATCGSTGSICRLRRARTPATRAAPTCRTSSWPATSFRVVAGARVDKFSSIDDRGVFAARRRWSSSRRADQSIRVSYNRAFRAPSMVNNNLDTTIATPLPLGLINPAFGSAIFLVPTTAVGNPDLKEESLTRSRWPIPATSAAAEPDLGRGVLHELQGRHLLHGDRAVDDAAARISRARTVHAQPAIWAGLHGAGHRLPEQLHLQQPRRR